LGVEGENRFCNARDARDKLRARPMSAYLEREKNAIYFLTDARRHKDEEIARNAGINLPAKAWWDSADDPNIRALKITPDDAEFWDSPGTIISYVEMAAAAVAGTRPDWENRNLHVMSFCRTNILYELSPASLCVNREVKSLPF